MTAPLPMVFIFEELNFGGTQKQHLEVARHMRKDIFTPYFWTLRAGDALLSAEERPCLTALRSDESLRPLPAIQALFKALRTHRPALIHLCTTFPNVWGRILGRLTRTPVIVASCRGLVNVRHQHERVLWPFAHAHICNARAIKNQMEAVGVPHKKIHYIANGVDTKHFSPASTGLMQAPHIVCVGRMVEEKDHATLIEAFMHVIQCIPQARLHLVGDGPLLQQVQDIVNTQGLSNAVLFHGASAHVRDHLRKARLLVLSSISEGMPNVILEGMACALPVVATQVGGIPDIVQHNKTGFLVPPKNSEALAKSIIHMLSSPALAEQMGAAGRTYIVQHHALDSVARQHEEVYIPLCEKAGLLAGC